jgi:septal ring factor EnvC (AmiA/AmiB activator)
MGEERVDPAFSYTDANIKKLKKELTKELRNLQDSLLETQRFLAKLQVRVVHLESIFYAEAYEKARSQFVSELTAASIKIGASKQPLVIAEQFTKRRWVDLEKLGIKSLRIPR